MAAHRIDSYGMVPHENMSLGMTMNMNMGRGRGDSSDSRTSIYCSGRCAHHYSLGGTDAEVGEANGHGTNARISKERITSWPQQNTHIPTIVVVIGIVSIT